MDIKTCAKLLTSVLVVSLFVELMYIQFNHRLEFTRVISNSSSSSDIVHQLMYANSTNSSSGLTENILGLNYFPNLIQVFNVPKDSQRKLPRKVAKKQYDVLMDLVEKSTKVLAEHNITAVLTYGSLIGSYMMHDMLPWDDDVDMFVHNDTKARVIAIFQDGRHHGIRCHHHSRHPGMMVKLFFENSPNAGKYEWKYPFIDIVTYVHQGKNVVAVDRGGKWGAPLETFYPLQLRPFGPLWLYAPKHPEVFLTSKYRQYSCVSSFWDHVHERGTNKKKTPCATLTAHYPYVKRTRVNPDYTMETLLLDGKEYYQLVFNVSYKITASPFEW